MYSNMTYIFANDLTLIKFGIKLFDDHIQYYHSKKYGDYFHASLQMSLASFFIGLETALNKFLLDRKNKLNNSKNKTMLISRKANMHELLNILKENDWIWKNRMINNDLIEKIRDSYKHYRIKIFHPNAKLKKKRISYPLAKEECTKIINRIFQLLREIYCKSYMRKDIVKELEGEFKQIKF